MSCDECEKIQEMNKEGRNRAYLRIGKATVLIGACDDHFNELQTQLGITPTVVFRVNPPRGVNEGD